MVALLCRLAVVSFLAAPASAATVNFTEFTTTSGYASLGLSISGAAVLESSLAIRDNILLDFSYAGGDDFGLVASGFPFHATAAAPIRIDFAGGATSVGFSNIVRNRPNTLDPDPSATLIDFHAQAYAADGTLAAQDTITTSSKRPLAPPVWNGTLDGGTIAYVLFFGGFNDRNWNLGVGQLTFTPAVPLPAAGVLLLSALVPLGLRLRRR